jgi:endonuclease YncB( thermonuclease family)
VSNKNKKMDYKQIIAAADVRLQNCNKQSADVFSLEGLVTAGKCYQVYDGDTCLVAINMDGELVSWKARIKNFDCAEMKSDDMVEKTLALEAKKRTIELIDGKVCSIQFGIFDKYGRVLVDVVNPDGMNVSTSLLKEQLAYPYQGKNRKFDWPALAKNRSVYLKNI